MRIRTSLLAAVFVAFSSLALAQSGGGGSGGGTGGTGGTAGGTGTSSGSVGATSPGGAAAGQPGNPSGVGVPGGPGPGNTPVTPNFGTGGGNAGPLPPRAAGEALLAPRVRPAPARQPSWCPSAARMPEGTEPPMFR